MITICLHDDENDDVIPYDQTVFARLQSFKLEIWEQRRFYETGEAPPIRVVPINKVEDLLENLLLLLSFGKGKIFYIFLILAERDGYEWEKFIGNHISFKSKNDSDYKVEKRGRKTKMVEKFKTAIG